jgi:hypothetical protein
VGRERHPEASRIPAPAAAGRAQLPAGITPPAAAETRLPALKTLTGFDYSSVRFTEDYGREALASLEFINQAQDLVLSDDFPGEWCSPRHVCAELAPDHGIQIFGFQPSGRTDASHVVAGDLVAFTDVFDHA